MAKEYKLSPQRLKELQDEMNYLKTVREKEVAELIKEARSFGDLSENSEYDEAKNDQAMMEARIADIESMLKNVKIIDESELSTEVIHIGSKIKVNDVEFDEVCEKRFDEVESGRIGGGSAETKKHGEKTCGRRGDGGEGDEIGERAGELGVGETEEKEIQDGGRD